MQQLTKTGRFLYGIGITSLGIHQLIIKNFRPEILPPFPAWAHQYIIFPVLAGIALIIAGIIISGIITIKGINTRNVCLYLAFAFLILIISCQLPDILIINPHAITHLETWFGVGEEIAYFGGALLMAGSYSDYNIVAGKNALIKTMEKLVPFGGAFFAILMIIFGCSHFVFTDAVSTMVPKWAGFPLFWTYFAGVALIAAGISFILKIWTKASGLLLALMLFIFFLSFHIPDAIANPSAGGGNEIFRAIVALLFVGISLVIAYPKVDSSN